MHLSNDTQSDVLIVGAGPAGLSLAIELSMHGVSCIVVERNERVGNSPRAKLTNVRTRELLRRWGIADALRDASPMPANYPSNIVFATAMNGHLLARFTDAFNCDSRRNDLYAESAQWVPQYTLEEVLRRKAVSSPSVALHFNVELESFADDGDGVSATVRDCRTGGTASLRAKYLVGADGARSGVRDAIGARMVGESAFAPNLNLIFRAPDLAERHGFGEAIMYWMVNSEVPAILGPMEGNGLWYLVAPRLESADLSSIDHKALIRRATGLDFEMEILAADPWMAHRLVADRCAKGRVFLVGDACHLHPPFGGYGMNMAVGDAVNLGWKIAAAVQGWAGGKLLASYEPERHPVHEKTVAEAVANYAAVGQRLNNPDIDREGLVGEAARNEMSDVILALKEREFRTLGMVLGYRYEGSPIVVPDGSPPPLDHPMIYEPSAHPGCRAPHLWLEDGSSLYDHFGPGFTLLSLAGDAAAAEAVGRAAAQRGVPLSVVSLDDPRLKRRYGAGLTLIRPDQHVAWRGDVLPSGLDDLFDRVLGGVARGEAQ